MAKTVKLFREQIYEQIRYECLLSHSKFVDKEFPPITGSLCYSRLKTQLRWKRPSEINRRAKFLDVSNIKCVHMNEGLLGRKVFILACAAISQDMEYFNRIIPSGRNSLLKGGCNKSDLEDAGVYHFHMYHFGEIVDVVVDDLLPTENGSEGICSHRLEFQEFWMSLLEKAYVKLYYGDYESMSVCELGEILNDLTGDVTENIAPLFTLLKATSLQDELFHRLLINKHEEKAMIIVVRIIENQSSSIIATGNVQHNKSKSRTSETDTDDGTLSDQSNKIFLNNYGLNHEDGFVITGFAEIPSERPLKLVRLFNPWRKNSYCGPFISASMASQQFSKHYRQWNQSGLLTYSMVNYEFFVPFSILLEAFTNIYVVHRLNEQKFMHQININGSWKIGHLGKSGEIGLGAGNHNFLRNPQYLLNVYAETSVPVHLQFEQEVARNSHGATHTKRRISLSMFHVEKDRETKLHQLRPLLYSSPPMPLRYLFHTMELNPGRYVLIPSNDVGRPGNFRLRIFSRAHSCNCEYLTKDSPNDSWWRKGVICQYDLAQSILIRNIQIREPQNDDDDGDDGEMIFGKSQNHYQLQIYQGKQLKDSWKLDNNLISTNIHNSSIDHSQTFHRQQKTLFSMMLQQHLSLIQSSKHDSLKRKDEEIEKIFEENKKNIHEENDKVFPSKFTESKVESSKVFPNFIKNAQKSSPYEQTIHPNQPIHQHQQIIKYSELHYRDQERFHSRKYVDLCSSFLPMISRKHNSNFPMYRPFIYLDQLQHVRLYEDIRRQYCAYYHSEPTQRMMIERLRNEIKGQMNYQNLENVSQSQLLQKAVDQIVKNRTMQTLGKSALRKKLIYELYLMVQQHQFVSNPFIQQKQSIDRHRRQAEIQKASQRYRRRQTLILESLTLPESKETEEVDDSSDSDDELSTAIVDRAQTTASTTLCTALSLWYENRMKKLRRVANSTHEISLVLNEYYDNLIHVILKKQLNDLSSTLFSTFLHCSLYHGIEENYDESITELIERTSLLSHVNNFIIDRFLQKQCDDNNLIRTNNEFRQHLTMLACWINASDESRANLCTTIYYRNRKMDKMRRKQSPQFSESYDEYCKKSMMNLHSNSTFFNATTLTYSNFSLYHNKNMKLTKLSDRVFNQETPRIKYVTKSDMDISRSEGYCQVLNNYRRQHRTNIRRHIDDHIYIYLFKYVNSPTTTTSTTTTTTTTITSISEQNEMKIPIGVIEWMNSSIGVFANLMIPFRSLTNFEEETSYIANIDIVNDNDHRHV